MVRTDDVASDNTVYSYNVADATIQIIGKGTVTDSQNKGWFTRVWDKVNPVLNHATRAAKFESETAWPRRHAGSHGGMPRQNAKG